MIVTNNKQASSKQRQYSLVKNDELEKRRKIDGARIFFIILIFRKLKIFFRRFYLEKIFSSSFCQWLHYWKNVGNNESYHFERMNIRGNFLKIFQYYIVY